MFYLELILSKLYLYGRTSEKLFLSIWQLLFWTFKIGDVYVYWNCICCYPKKSIQKHSPHKKGYVNRIRGWHILPKYQCILKCLLCDRWLNLQQGNMGFLVYEFWGWGKSAVFSDLTFWVRLQLYHGLVFLFLKRSVAWLNNFLLPNVGSWGNMW